MEAYTGFASVYDLFMDNIPYKDWCAYVTGLLKEHGISDGLLLDLGCGTGKLTRLLAAEGYDMIGVDLSEEMLEIALERWKTRSRFCICCRICGSLNCTAPFVPLSVSAIP